MNLKLAVMLCAVFCAGAYAADAAMNALSEEETKDGFVLLFDGKALTGWKPNESPDSFKVVDGKILAGGPRSHLYYMGEVANHNFKNFEFRAKVLVHPASNSGIYVQAAWLDTGWPLAQGYECQVCSQGYTDPRKTGSIYKFNDVKEAPVKDEEWFDYHIIVKGDTIKTIVNGKTVAEFTEPADKKRLKGGTFAIQSHDPKSKVEYHTLRVKLLPE